MSAALQSLPEQKPNVSFERMEIHHVKEVVAIETDVFPFPWSYASFVNCMTYGYDCWVMRDESDVMIGYFIVMKVVDEAHLLTFAVRSGSQGRGFGRVMLEKVIAIAHELGMDSVFLEVRPSNRRAWNLYERFGFAEIGRRKNYYQAAGNAREDGIMMRLPL